MQTNSRSLACRFRNFWISTKFFISTLAEDRNLIQRIRSEKITYLSFRKLSSLAGTCRKIEKSGIEGIFIEAGCALGGSSILMASIKTPDRVLRIYDVFGMIPPPTEADTHDVHERYAEIVMGKAAGIDGDTYYGYESNLFDRVESNLRKFGISRTRQNIFLIKGLVQDTLQVDVPVALAHIDVDWYEPVLTCLQRIYPKLVVGGCIILDDYHDWGGCRKAVDEFIQSITGGYGLDDTAGSLRITKFCD